ncbi:hypothetical protein F511_01955 [Dorcoceras hygrometricum]|uniref:TF-B3 domain-containing protein n=1 Tax=Dorcoceras hygrometricum TaxID=472368 RepID=A0A2Z7AT14_9LAMI|nr:hypothetical protein F511_01955 [Dorcoceras hygrometricum]
MMASSFYKLLITDDFNSQLRLPPQFVEDHAEIVLRKATLRVETGESWIVRIERIGEHHFFTEGWEKFASDVALEFKQFLLFMFDGESGFHVSVYEMSGCKKELVVCNDTSGGSEHHGYGVSTDGDLAVKPEIVDEDVRIVEDHGLLAVKQLRFRAKLGKRNETELEVPRDFAETTGIAENGRIFLLTQPSSKKWPVIVTARRREESFAMTVGWNDFLVGRKVRVGSTILFEFLSNRDDIVIGAKVVKNGKMALYSPKKRRGRPPKLQVLR